MSLVASKVVHSVARRAATMVDKLDCEQAAPRERSKVDKLASATALKRAVRLAERLVAT